MSAANFTQARKGFDTNEVRDFLRMVAAELARLQERERFLERELRSQQHLGVPSAVAVDDELVTRLLGEEAARVLQTAREAASQIKVRAEEGAARLLREATDEAQRLREEAEIEASRRRNDAAADAEAELQMARQQGRDMVNEARAYREKVLGELARRRELARQQIEQLVHGRDRLLQAFDRARAVSIDVMAELTPLGEPGVEIDLSPTTGPVPVITRDTPRPTPTRRHDAATAPGETLVHEPQADDTIVDEMTVVDAAMPDAVAADETTSDDTTRDEVFDDLAPPSTPVVEADTADTPTGTSDGAATTADAGDATVVVLEVAQAHDLDHIGHDDREPAPVVNLFAPALDAAEGAADVEGDVEPAVDVEGDVEAEPVATSPITEPRHDAGALFARLRASRAEDVAERVAERVSSASTTQEPPAAPESEPTVVTVGSADSVFATTPEAPALVAVLADTPFSRRDEALTPLIVNAARKLKRVLADEQNDVLHALRGKHPVRSVDELVADADTQRARYADAISSELVAAAVGGAISMGMRSADAQREMKRADVRAAASVVLASEIVDPLRDRLARCVADADGDNAELATLVRVVYREWKGQQIDEHLDHVARTAYGRGALAGAVPGTRVCWLVDPAGPPCADAEDNALAGDVAAGEAFPTGHSTAPAHTGCRCVLAPA